MSAFERTLNYSISYRNGLICPSSGLYSFTSDSLTDSSTYWHCRLVLCAAGSMQLSGVCQSVSPSVPFAGRCCRFAAVVAIARRYRDRLLHARRSAARRRSTALCSKCGQRHVVSWRRKLNTDLFRCTLWFFFTYLTARCYIFGLRAGFGHARVTLQCYLDFRILTVHVTMLLVRTVSGSSPSTLHVSRKKRIPDICRQNSSKNCLIFKIFGTTINKRLGKQRIVYFPNSSK